MGTKIVVPFDISDRTLAKENYFKMGADICNAEIVPVKEKGFWEGIPQCLQGVLSGMRIMSQFT